MKHRNLRLAVAITLLSLTTALVLAAPDTRDAQPPAVKSLTMMSASIPSSDLDRSIAFYSKGLGMTLAGRVEMGDVIEAPLMFPGGGAYLMLQYSKVEDSPLPIRGSLNRIVLMTPDLKSLETQLNAAGYQLKDAINDMPEYRVAVAHIEDPDGNHLELIQRTP